jgi:hypothetical protein
VKLAVEAYEITKFHFRKDNLKGDVSGLKLDLAVINYALRLFDRMITSERLHQWTLICWMYLEDAFKMFSKKNSIFDIMFSEITLQTHEFLSLACNAQGSRFFEPLSTLQRQGSNPKTKFKDGLYRFKK